MKLIKSIHAAASSPINDLITYRALPTNSISMNELNPFILLNHHGPQEYQPDNKGLPFGPHPHRGMETVTFIIEGDIMHKDSDGHESIIISGGVQWMTAGRGLIHAEVSSDEFKRNGGKLEILQLWLNLPAKYKMKEPFYEGLQGKDIPVVAVEEDRVKLKLIAGSWNNINGAFNSVSNVFLSEINFIKDGKLTLKIPEEENILFYIVKGKLNVNEKEADAFKLIEFDHDGVEINVEALADSILLFGHAVPLDEPIVAQGPFVMTSEKEIKEAYADFKNGKFGTWKE